jgi:hypothetical protein
MKVIGPAHEFWRVRLSRLDTADEPDLEWRDDILYREPPSSRLPDVREWNVEAVRLEDDEVALIASFSDEAEARAFLGEAQTDLADLTRSAFERKYLEGDLPTDADATADVNAEESGD